MSKKIFIRKSSVFRKYFLSILAIIFVVFLILGSSLLIFVSRYWKNENIDLLSENVKTLSHTASKYFELNVDDNGQYSTVLLAYSISLVSSSIDSDIYICDLNGNIILCKDMIQNASLNGSTYCIQHSEMKIPDQIVRSAMESDYIHIGAVEGLYDEYNLLVGQPIKVDGQVIAVVLGAKQSVTALYPFVTAILRMFAASGLLSLIFAFLVVYVITYSLTKPLRAMSKATKSYATGDFSQRLEVRGHDEVAELASALNTMAQSLSVIESSRRSFVANVSHELKTPMTIIGGFVDGILDGTIPREQQDHYLKIASDEVKRLARLITSMLNLSKIEAGELSLQLKRIDISALIFNTMLTFETSINKKSVEVIGLDTMSSTYLNADEGLIHQVVYNLIDNAVKFTPEKGYIEISVHQDTEHTTVTIKNSGQGIPSDEINRIFERFYKVDKSRSLDVKSTGLGLYIVKSIVETHGGTVTAESEVGSYTAFSFTLPNE